MSDSEGRTVPVGKDSRVLWLLNHTTLRGFEVPLLRTLGLEVYTSKLFTDVSDNRSCSTDFSWDVSLSIPANEIEALNAFNFYDEPINPIIRSIINNRFGTVIVAYIPKMLDSLIENFTGRILLRAFGLTSPKWTYFTFAKFVCDPGFTKRLAGVRDRFWFAQAYPNLDKIESGIVKARSITLPLGLPESIAKKAQTWRGGNGKVLFVCPDIGVYQESKEIYDEFKRDFGDLPHHIGGAQTVPVKDGKVLGRLSRENYDAMMSESAVMYYQSELPRHIHYHPVEAVSLGLPLIFMAKGMLGELGNGDLPGACRSSSEARAKIKRVLKGDKRFIAEVLESQKRILEYFSPENNARFWKENFLGKVLKTPMPRVRPPARIAVLCLDETSTLYRDVALQLARTLQEEAKTSGERTDIVLGVPSGPLWSSVIREKNPDLSIEECVWQVLSSESVRIIQEFTGFRRERISENYCLLDDGKTQFTNCDFFVLVGDMLSIPYAPIRPYAIFVWDQSKYRHEATSTMQRSSFNSYLSMSRMATMIFSDNRSSLKAVADTFCCDVNKIALTRLIDHPKAPLPQPSGPLGLAILVGGLSHDVQDMLASQLMALILKNPDLKRILFIGTPSETLRQVQRHASAHREEDSRPDNDEIEVRSIDALDSMIHGYLLAGVSHLWCPQFCWNDMITCMGQLRAGLKVAAPHDALLLSAVNSENFFSISKDPENQCLEISEVLKGARKPTGQRATTEAETVLSLIKKAIS